MEYITNPRLKNPEDLYYDGIGCTWGVDLDGKRYEKVLRRNKPNKQDRESQRQGNRESLTDFYMRQQLGNESLDDIL